MPKRPRHLDQDLIRAVNPEGEDLLAPAAPLAQPPDKEVAALKMVRAFVQDYPRSRHGADTTQALALSEALLGAMALLVKRDPEQLRRELDRVMYDTDLSREALAQARRNLNLLDRKTLPELLEGPESRPGPLPEPITLAGEGPSAAEMVLEDREAPTVAIPGASRVPKGSLGSRTRRTGGGKC